MEKKLYLWICAFIVAFTFAAVMRILIEPSQICEHQNWASLLPSAERRGCCDDVIWASSESSVWSSQQTKTSCRKTCAEEAEEAEEVCLDVSEEGSEAHKIANFISTRFCFSSTCWRRNETGFEEFRPEGPISFYAQSLWLGASGYLCALSINDSEWNLFPLLSGEDDIFELEA
jgi:hypothetical protein